MTDETTVQVAGAVVPANVPQSDAQAAAQDAANPAVDPAPAKQEEDAEEKKRNRTREYINKQNRTIGELRAQLEMERQAKAQQQPVQQQPQQGKPTLASCNYDIEAHAEAVAEWAAEKRVNAAREQWIAEQKSNAEKAQKQTAWQSYEQRAVEFVADHPDYLEVVNSIRYPLHDAMQAAIAAHPNGPAIAYHLGNNDDDAFQLAAIQPSMAAAAVERLASRLTATPQAPNKPIPITNAPPVPPRVGGRAPTNVPPEKMTDDQWLAQERAKRRKA